ncbi:MAG TPA: PBP1A family penicillin-binding protein, partial [Longimicrobium sp.]|nr:PBP1A family penicillin-binding protein [Longimicrobium sp.]
MPRKPRPARAPGPSRRRKALRALLVVLAFGIGAGGGLLAYLWPRCSGAGCPSVDTLRTYQPPQASQLFDGGGKLVAYLAPERRTVVRIERIPAHVSGAFLAVEDKRFYRHRGVDYRRLFGAVARNVQALSYRQGFSTVTMQLARNVFPEYLSREKTIRRKLWEVVLARRIERAFSKDEILEMYLNQIYLGQGQHGVEAAARGYFGKPAAKLTEAEAATLAALPKAPSFYDPRRNPDGALRRRNLVLGLMADAGVVTGTEAAMAQGQPLGLAPPPEALGEAPYFVSAVRRELRERFGPRADTDGLRVYTSLDPVLQKNAEQELRRQIAAVEKGQHGRFRHASCAGGSKRPERCLQGLFVAMSPRTGDVWALVGGRDYALSQFDRVTQARRQAGSAFKPFVFAAALSDGIAVSAPLLGPGAEVARGAYWPRDHVADSATVDMRDALRLSSNRAAVVLGERVGAGRVVKTAHDMGISTPIQPLPSTFLGAASVMPLELVAAYAPFANGGSSVRPRLIRRVEDAHGRVLFEARVARKPVISPGVAFLTTSMMRGVVDRGTGSGVRQAGLSYEVPAAGKTGTTNEGADVWFVGFTPDLVAGVWLGFDKPRAILANASGGGLAAPVWGRVVSRHYQRHAVPAAWGVPSDLVGVPVDRASGKLASAACPGESVATEYFVAGTEP